LKKSGRDCQKSEAKTLCTFREECCVLFVRRESFAFFLLVVNSILEFKFCFEMENWCLMTFVMKEIQWIPPSQFLIRTELERHLNGQLVKKSLLFKDR